MGLSYIASKNVKWFVFASFQNSTLENSLVVLLNLNIYLSLDPEIELLGIYVREMKMNVHSKTCMECFQYH